MGKLCSKPQCEGLLSKGSAKIKRVRVLMFGWEESGKTTILYQLKLGKFIRTLPTLSDANNPNKEVFKHRSVSFRILDAGGIEQLRPLWPDYYRGETESTQALIFVVDSSDRENIANARDEVAKLLNDAELRDAVLLVFANKQDLPNVMTQAEVTEGLDLRAFPQRRWYVQHSCARNGEGLYEGLDQVVSMIEEKQLERALELSSSSNVSLNALPFRLNVATSSVHQGVLALLLLVVIVFRAAKKIATLRRPSQRMYAGPVLDFRLHAEVAEEAEL